MECVLHMPRLLQISLTCIRNKKQELKKLKAAGAGSSIMRQMPKTRSLFKCAYFF